MTHITTLLPLFDHRDFSPAVQPGVRWRVRRLTWTDAGGPDTAELRADLPACEPPDLLRCPLRILDESGMPAWWGYVERVELQWDALCLRWDIAPLVNRAAVLYADPAAPGPWSRGLQLTPWADDPASQARYGVKERVLRLPHASYAEACAARDALLAENAFPHAALLPRPSGGQPGLRLLARGWQHTFDWILAPRDDGLAEYTPRGGIVQPLGASAAATALAQSLRVTQAGEYTRLWLRLGRHAAPLDALRVALHADAAGVPAASPLSSLLVPGSSLSPSPAWELFSLPAVSLDPATPYWIVLSRSGSPSAVNYYEAALDEGAYYPDGLALLHDGSAWAARSPAADVLFRLESVAPLEQQLTRILGDGSGGQFLAGIEVSASASTPLPVPRTDFADCGSLFRAALTQNAALTALVTPERVLRICARPGQPALSLDPAGRLLRLDGQPLPLYQPAAGQSALFAPGLLDAPLYIARAVYTPAGGLRVG